MQARNGTDAPSRNTFRAENIAGACSEPRAGGARSYRRRGKTVAFSKAVACRLQVAQCRLRYWSREFWLVCSSIASRCATPARDDTLGFQSAIWNDWLCGLWSPVSRGASCSVRRLVCLGLHKRSTVLLEWAPIRKEGFSEAAGGLRSGESSVHTGPVYTDRRSSRCFPRNARRSSKTVAAAATTRARATRTFPSTVSSDHVLSRAASLPSVAGGETGLLEAPIFTYCRCYTSMSSKGAGRVEELRWIAQRLIWHSRLPERSAFGIKTSRRISCPGLVIVLPRGLPFEDHVAGCVTRAEISCTFHVGEKTWSRPRAYPTWSASPPAPPHVGRQTLSHCARSGPVSATVGPFFFTPQELRSATACMRDNHDARPPLPQSSQHSSG
ncbi:hypothetical protein L1887_55817 [Cichorium endivia]|nr:hypothetical protein L1887_55817 [Cichorium endivia]